MYMYMCIYIHVSTCIYTCRFLTSLLISAYHFTPPLCVSRANSLLASLPQHTGPRLGLGVPVLPPISTSPHQSPPLQEHPAPSLPPTSTPPSIPRRPYLPPYTQSTTATTTRSSSPPPPYYPSLDEAAARSFPQPVLPSQQQTPSHYTLPDPQVHYNIIHNVCIIHVS